MTLAEIPVYCIVLPETPARLADCERRMTEQGINPTYYRGYHGDTSGLRTTHVYEKDHPGSGYVIGSRQVGLYLSHWILWESLRLAAASGWTNAPAYMIIEDDADFHPGWQDKVNAALAAMPDDWDYLAPGNCDCGPIDPREGPSQPKVKRGPDLYEARFMCTHCYIVRTASLPKIIDPLRKIWASLDIALYYDAFPHMRVFAILPRCVDQVNTALNP